jgi:hypothetical protein
MRRIACATLLLAATAAAGAKYCPRVLYRATRLVVVMVPNMQATEASVRTFERKSPAARWEQRGDAERGRRRERHCLGRHLRDHGQEGRAAEARG